MGLRSMSRTALGGYIKAVRIPVDAVLKVAGRGGRTEPAVDRADAAARDVAGAALGDDELRRDAKLRRTAADEREQATDLRDAADAREETATKQRKQAAKRASAKRSTAERKRQSTRSTAASTAQKRKA